MNTLTLGYVTGRTEIDESNRAVLFGELVKLAVPVIKAYHSDLFHDAIWLTEHVKGPEFTFYYSIDDCGTLIGTELKLVLARDHRYRITVRVDEGKSELDIEKLEADACGS